MQALPSFAVVNSIQIGRTCCMTGCMFLPRWCPGMWKGTSASLLPRSNTPLANGVRAWLPGSPLALPGPLARSLVLGPSAPTVEAPLPPAVAVALRPLAYLPPEAARVVTKDAIAIARHVRSASRQFAACS